MKIDDLNVSILKHLRDGRKSFKEIAEVLSVTENTIRARVNKMQDEQILDIAGLVDPELVPGLTLAIIGVKLDTMSLVSKAEEFSKLRGVVWVGVVTGRYDLMLTVLLNENLTFLKFFTEEMSRIKDVQSTETFVVYKGYNLKVPYVL
ncbi:MAG: Lrp/AsnC family transcriptional regulator [Spirochaetota bacterium]